MLNRGSVCQGYRAVVQPRPICCCARGSGVKLSSASLVFVALSRHNVVYVMVGIVCQIMAAHRAPCQSVKVSDTAGPLCVKFSKKRSSLVSMLAVGPRAQCQILGHPAARVKVPAAPCVKVSKCQKFRPAPGPYYPPLLRRSWSQSRNVRGWYRVLRGHTVIIPTPSSRSHAYSLPFASGRCFALRKR